MRYYKITLTNKLLDSSSAEVVPHESGTIVTYSDNPVMKQHLDTILSRPATILAPGKMGPGFHADGVLTLWPGSAEFAVAIPEILSWHGYECEEVREVHKSFEFLDFTTIKSFSPGSTYQNAEGDTIVKYVPEGYVAYSVDGDVVAAGRWLNANITKDDAKWFLIEIGEYGDMSQDDRIAAEEAMAAGVLSPHPAVQESIFEPLEEGQYHFSEFIPREGGIPLREFVDSGAKGLVTPPGEAPLDYDVPPHHILYSKTLGVAVKSEHWPPKIDDYGNYRWHIFDVSKYTDLSDEERELFKEAQERNMAAYVTGFDENGIAQLDEGLDMYGASVFMMPGDGDIVLAEPLVDELPSRAELEMSERYLRKVAEASKAVNKHRRFVHFTAEDEAGRSRVELHPDIEEEYASFSVSGPAAVFGSRDIKLRPYQAALVAAVTEVSQYEKYGGPVGAHGHMIAAGTGTGKTAVALAADARMRNMTVEKDGVAGFENGRQLTVITGPSAQPRVWQSEVSKFRGEEAIVIDGSPAERRALWDRLVLEATRGELSTNIIILANSKFRQEGEGVSSIDAQYLQLLAQGGTLKDKVTVEGGHIAALIVDEAGQFMNHDSQRSEVLTQVAESVYQGGGLVWAMSAHVSSNSVTDTLAVTSLINKSVRDDFKLVEVEYARATQNSPNRKAWKSREDMERFRSLYGSSFIPLDSRTIAGDKYAVTRLEDREVGLGENWYHAYIHIQSMMTGMYNSDDRSLKRKSLGAMQMLFTTSLGATAPARLIEYRADSRLLEDMREQLTAEDWVLFKEQVESFRKETSVTIEELGPRYGRPNTEVFKTVEERDALFEETVDAHFREMMDETLYSWKNPYRETIVDSIATALTESSKGQNARVGIAIEFARPIRDIQRALHEKLGDKVTSIVIDGSVSDKDVQRMQEEFQTLVTEGSPDTTRKPMVAFVTSAGAFGLSLPADVSFRFPTWSVMKGEQMDGRWARSPTQEHMSQIIYTSGISEYRRELELQKGEIESMTRHFLADEYYEIEDLSTVAPFFSALGHGRYRPFMVKEGS